MGAPSTENGGKNALLRALPSIEQLLRRPSLEERLAAIPRPRAVAALRLAVARVRERLLRGEARPFEDSDVDEALRVLATPNLRPVLNATGVVLHTNLGRAPLAPEAVARVAAVARGYSNLEYDLDEGERGSRYAPVVELLTQLTGAEDALVVNNCAGATLLALSAVVADAPRASHAPGSPPEVIVSRGQLIEIGGGFRIPEVLELSGARLREVGTTNRTRLSDYERAISEETRAILWVHPSNFEIQGFTESVGVAELSSLGPPVVADVGSGALLPMSDEPRVEAAVRDGAALTIFSGDKLLGGPQAGIAVGESYWISAMRHHPLARALRADKLCLAALEATLAAYLEGTASAELPTLKMLHAPPEEMKERADRLAAEITRAAPNLPVDVAPSIARSGGGTLPLYEIPSYAVRLGVGAFNEAGDADALAAKLRSADPPVVGRVGEGRLWLDVRSLLDGDEEEILRAVERLYG